jgi:hypothetical protein
VWVVTVALVVQLWRPLASLAPTPKLV